jgi:hypothetical protein
MLMWNVPSVPAQVTLPGAATDVAVVQDPWHDAVPVASTVTAFPSVSDSISAGAVVAEDAAHAVPTQGGSNRNGSASASDSADEIRLLPKMASPTPLNSPPVVG